MDLVRRRVLSSDMLRYKAADALPTRDIIGLMSTLTLRTHRSEEIGGHGGCPEGYIWMGKVHLYCAGCGAVFQQ